MVLASEIVLSAKTYFEHFVLRDHAFWIYEGVLIKKA
jgi:hypothetical protein